MVGKLVIEKQGTTSGMGAYIEFMNSVQFQGGAVIAEGDGQMSIDPNGWVLNTNGESSVDWGNRTLQTSDNSPAMNWKFRRLQMSNNQIAAEWGNGFKSMAGASAGRAVSFPNALGLGDAGVQYFDTDLGMPIWWSGTQWVDATGSAA